MESPLFNALQPKRIVRRTFFSAPITFPQTGENTQAADKTAQPHICPALSFAALPRAVSLTSFSTFSGPGESRANTSIFPATGIPVSKSRVLFPF